MVDKDQILKKIHIFCIIHGAIEIDPGTGVVDVVGDVRVDKPVKQLPIKFGTVSGYFICNALYLESLDGAPHHVGGDFSCSYNSLVSLEGGPRHVNGNYYCLTNPLESLEGAPDHVGGMFRCLYQENLPLLRTLNYLDAQLMNAPAPVKQILNKYAGTKNPGDILTCASELTEAGFDGNAEW